MGRHLETKAYYFSIVKKGSPFTVLGSQFAVRRWRRRLGAGWSAAPYSDGTDGTYEVRLSQGVVRPRTANGKRRSVNCEPRTLSSLKN